MPEEGDAPRSIVIVGASLAGGTAAGVLRDHGYEGRLSLIGAEEEPPYERPPLSKELLRGELDFEDALVRPASWYEEHDVDARFGTMAVQIDVHAREVVLAGGERLPFDRLLVSTGSRNRRLEVPGAGLPGVFDLRYHRDAVRIRDAAKEGARVVCVGMGFIGAEVAASLRAIGCDVTVVEIFETTLYRILGPEIGRVLEGIHRDHGVTMHFSDSVERFEGDSRLERVVTESGKQIDADVAVIGVGTEPAVEIMAGTGLDQGGGIRVGSGLETTVPGVFAAGDVALHDHPVFGPIRVEHYDNAVKMGEHSANAMLGSAKAFDDPHWFWSDQYDSKIEMAGYAPTWDRMVVRGSLEERSFCAFLLDSGGVVRSTVSLDWKRDVRRSFGLIRSQVAPDPEALVDPDVDLRKLVPQPESEKGG
ncbi:MAG TPA: FAD-dependent oxidoreductase [Actinomycetota bacterium]|nr:FAD-dependent oxidoreductase [Actinomycetota bacterium]